MKWTKDDKLRCFIDFLNNNNHFRNYFPGSNWILCHCRMESHPLQVNIYPSPHPQPLLSRSVIIRPTCRPICRFHVPLTFHLRWPRSNALSERRTVTWHTGRSQDSGDKVAGSLPSSSSQWRALNEGDYNATLLAEGWLWSTVFRSWQWGWGACGGWSDTGCPLGVVGWVYSSPCRVTSSLLQRF